MPSALIEDLPLACVNVVASVILTSSVEEAWYVGARPKVGRTVLAVGLAVTVELEIVAVEANWLRQTRCVAVTFHILNFDLFDWSLVEIVGCGALRPRHRWEC